MEAKILTDELDNFGLGHLYVASDKELLAYQPFEVSQYRLAIIAKKGLEAGTELLLATPIGSVRLKIDEVSEQHMECLEGYLGRYKLASLDLGVNIERLFKRLGCDKYLDSGLGVNSLQNVRFAIEPCMGVEVKTFGSQNNHMLSTVNVSKTGMLLSADKDYHVPFIENTLLELRVSPSRSEVWVKNQFECLAKVVRCTTVETEENRNVRQFGIKLIELSEEAKEIWDDAIKIIEQDSVMKDWHSKKTL